MSTSREEMILCKHSHSSESLTNKKYQHCPAVRYNIAMISKSRQFSLKAPSKLHLSGALVIFFRAGYEPAAPGHCAIFAQPRRKT